MDRRIESSLRHFQRNAKYIIRDGNRLSPLPYYLLPFTPTLGSYRIADLGCGLICSLGCLRGSRKIEVVASDILQPYFKEIWKMQKCEPVIPVEYQDMESLTYPDESFDIVHCVNALDHTPDARKALDEMRRVCKTGGWIYLRHFPNQRAIYKKHHYWNATLEGFSNRRDSIKLTDFFISFDGWNITATWNKV